MSRVLLLILASSMSLTSGGSIRFWQISDVHADLNYDPVHGDVKNFCHSDENSKDDERSGGPGRYGNFNCDSPWILAEAAIRKMYEIEPNPDFILWTGDSSPHYDQNWNYVYTILRKIGETIRKYFPHTTVIPVLGNHDAYPADYYEANTTDLYEKYLVNAGWNDLIPQSSQEEFKQCGFYRYSPPEVDNLTFLGLNTNLYYHNKVEIHEADPCGQLHWLKKNLEASKDGDRIMIVSHIPPGYFDRYVEFPLFNKSINDAYVSIVSDKKLSQNVVAHFYGHLHTDSFRILMDNRTRQEPVGVAFTGSSVTPLVASFPNLTLGTNPGIRLYFYNSEEPFVDDYHQYYLPLDKLTTRRRTNDKFLNHRKKRDDGENTTESPATTEVDSTTEAVTIIGDSNSTAVSTENETSLLINETTTVQNDEENTIATTMAVVTFDTTTEDDTTTATTPQEAPAFDENDVDFLVNHFTLNYKAKTAFNVTDLRPKQMLLVLKRIEIRDSTAFRRYYKHSTMNHDVGPCDEICFQRVVCTIYNLKVQHFRDCLESSFSYPLDLETTTNGISSTTMITTNPPFSGGFPGSIAAGTNTEKSSHGHIIRGIVIGFCVVGLLSMAAFVLVVYRRNRRNRYRSQEFLLTDSVFKYDGYSQLDQP